jgi:hypothetical protein
MFVVLHFAAMHRPAFFFGFYFWFSHRTGGGEASVQP